MVRLSSPDKSGFTLIELLVVIAIIAILAALLLRSLAKSKAQAQSIVCKNHPHEMTLALRMYVDDNKAYPYYANFVYSSAPGYGWSGPIKWEDALHPYYPIQWTNRAYHCPSYNGPVSAGLLPAQPGYWGWTGSYSYNTLGATSEQDPGRGLGLGMVMDPSNPDPGPPACREAQVLSPSEMFAVMDARGGDEGPESGASWSGLDWATGTQF